MPPSKLRRSSKNEIVSFAENAFISGIGKVEGGKRMIVLLDMEKILSSQEQGALANVARAGAR